MKIAVDARLLAGGGNTGRYVRELAGRWLEADAVREIRFLGSPEAVEAWLGERPEGAVKARILPWTDAVGSLRARMRWKRHGREWTAGCDVVFFPTCDAPGRAAQGPPRVVAAHDLARCLDPRPAGPSRTPFGRVPVRRTLRSAAAVVTVSEAGREELAAAYPFVKHSLRVVANGVAHETFRPLDGRERTALAARWSTHRPFVLAVGPILPHRNLATALRAIGALRGLRPDLRLVHVGPRRIRDPEVRRALRDPHTQRRFTQLGELDDRTLRELYGVGEALLHPTRRDGFAVPPLQAMACGAPVLAADRSGLPEVTGEAARLLDPDDPEAWMKAILEVTADDELRGRMIRAGLERASAFSWETTAEETLAILREAAGTTAGVGAADVERGVEAG